MFDIHSHVLPGIDDGSKSFAMSLDILRGLEKQGITNLICTPHYISETKQTSTRAANQKLLKQLQEKAQKEGIDINLYLGNEIYIDRDIKKLLKAKKISALNGGKYILIELPISGEYDQYEDVLQDLKLAGWQPILAHPERYVSFQNDYSKVIDLHRIGILFQCNLGSVIGQYGKHAKKLIKHMAKENLIFCFGTDIHRPRDYSEITKAQKKLQKYYSAAELNTLLAENPAKIVK